MAEQLPSKIPAKKVPGPATKSGQPADLSEIDLATGVDRIPEWWNRHGNKVLIAFTISALGYALYTFRANSALSARISAEQNLAVAREALTALRVQTMDPGRDDLYASARRQALSEASSALSEVLGRSSDDDQIVQALVLRGDLNYLIALLPDPPAAATRPTLKLDRTPEQLFAASRESFQEILNRYASRTQDAAHARLGLAAIAENTGDFDAAKKLYEQVAGDADVLPSFKDSANRRLEMLPDLARPMRMRGASTQPAGAPLPPPTTRP